MNRVLKKIPSDIKVTLVYIFIGSLWIQFSDKGMRTLFTNPEEQRIVELTKGWFYVAITGILLYLMIRKELKEKNELLEELNKSKLKAEESDKLKTAFLSNMSHYLRTPMNSILGFVDILKRRNLDEERREKFLSIVNEQSNHLLQFIDNLVEASKLQEGQTTVNAKEFAINELLDRILKRYTTEMEYIHKIQYINLICIYPENKANMYSDADKIEYILANLLSNSVKFTQLGEIRFGVEIKNDKAEFFVIDTGIGIPPEKQKNFIDAFLQSDPYLSHDNIGSGVGMALTNGFVKLLGGKLWLESSSKAGTHIRFTLPVHFS